MITIIHGDDIAASRNYYKQLQTSDTISLDGEKITHEDIVGVLQTTGLFEEKKSLAIEQFFSKRKASKDMDMLIADIQASAKKADIVLWESKVLTSKMLRSFPSALEKVFTFPKSLFLFLDAIKPNNTKRLLTLYHQTVQTTEAEMILVMLIRQIRMLLAVTDTSSDTIDEIKKLSPWQQKKLMTQAQQFSQEQLLSLHATLFEIEVKSKTGGLSLPLVQTIDFFLLSF